MAYMKASEVLTNWVFGYGSLIWNPEFEYERAELAQVHGYHRAFCVGSTRYRGSVRKPGVVLGLDHGGSCVGLAFQLGAASRAAIVDQLFEREIPDPRNRVYLPRIIEARLRSGARVPALAFVADRSRPSYHRLSDTEILERLASCHGQRGANRDYAIHTWEALRARGVDDLRLQRVVRLLGAHDASPGFRPRSACEAASPVEPRPSETPSDQPEFDDSGV